MYEVVLVLHSLLRWALLAIAVYAVGRAILGKSNNQPFTKADEKAGLFLTITADVQLLLGLLLYAFLSPLTQAAFQDFGAAMKTPGLRYFAVEHFLMMLIAIVLFHIGKTKVKKATTDQKKHNTAAWFYGIGLLLILSRIPWSSDKLFRWFV